MGLKHYEDYYASLFAISLTVGVLLFVAWGFIEGIRHIIRFFSG